MCKPALEAPSLRSRGRPGLPTLPPARCLEKLSGPCGMLHIAKDSGAYALILIKENAGPLCSLPPPAQLACHPQKLIS